MGEDAQRTSIPLFPLSNVVLFPGVAVPLHVFEPRYRAMTADALAGARTIGMVAVRGDGVGEMAGDPPLHPYGCAGRIETAEKLDDGRYHIVLQGTRRFRIEREIPRGESRLYRVAEVSLLEDASPPGDAERLRASRREVLERFLEIVRRTAPDRHDELSDGLLAETTDAVFVNTFCQLLDLDPIEKQSLLQTGILAERCEQLAMLLHFRLAELRGGAPGREQGPH